MLVCKSNSVLALYGGDRKAAQGLVTYLRSRDNLNLKAEFQLGNGEILVDCIENQPAVRVVLGDHVFLTVGDEYLSNES
ncbi:hypothetical protein EUGRSUZ_H00406 [Eucalyptus grandis]|uniref:Uncharacterized protein n=3 Tax=Eucalyptus grandis TaxID=71139 RepID=A0ACC3JJW0_EUCGR|nr:hypothetical protein EUGRSUZ_H00406 [Eucalyptus grandis]